MLTEYTIDAHIKPTGRIVFPVWAGSAMEAHRLAHQGILEILGDQGVQPKSFHVTATEAVVGQREINDMIESGMIEVGPEEG
jgi:hypothetical protein